MTLNPQLTPFEAALQSLAQRQALPTNLDSHALSQLGPAFHRDNLVSAKNNIAGLMDDLKAVLEKIVNPTTQQRADRITPANPQGNVSGGLDPATARLQVKELMQQYSYSAAGGDAGTIKDLASDKRINLFLKTNVELSQGRGWFLQSQDRPVLDAFPANELIRIEERAIKRDWHQRWRIAAAVAGDSDAARVLEFHGRMIALKDSGIWQALGDGAGGYEDTLGNPFPPFAFNSGMDVRDISYEQALALELLNPGERVEAAPFDLTKLFNQAA